ncbi:hypothetical protein, partial [Lysinibacillus fusiformis]|uniref:hypothetical protein n=1 Tax=Lysinibacillus fusiformis TaxID=28031 RepID=UPI0020C080F6
LYIVNFPFIYKNKFKKYIDTENKTKIYLPIIISYRTVSYDDNSIMNGGYRVDNDLKRENDVPTINQQ